MKAGTATVQTDIPALLFAIVAGAIAAFITVQSPVLGVAAVGALIGFAVILQRPEIPFSLLILSIAIPLQKTVAGIPLNMADGVIVVWGMAWPFFMMRKAEDRLRIPFIVWAALPLIVCAMLSLLTAVNTGGTVKQIIRLIEWFMVLPVLMMAFHVADRRLWDWAAAIFIAIPALFALDGIVEVLNNGRSISKILGIEPPIPSALSKIRHTFDVSGRAGSTFGGAQGLAMYLAMTMSVTISLIVFPPRPIWRKLAIVSLVICLGGMYFAKSRGGLLGGLVMGTVLLLVARPRFGFTAVAVGGTLIAGGLFSLLLIYGWDGALTSLVPGRAEAVLDRLIIWGRALEVFADSPLTGVGFGGFKDAVYAHGGINLNVPLGYESLHCHNTYLEVLTGTGLLGFTAYIGFLLACLLRLLRGWRERQGNPSDAFILAALGSLGAYMTFGMVDMLFLQNMHFLLVSILMLGLLAATVRKDAAP